MDQVQRTTNVPQTQFRMALVQIMEQQLCLNGINSRLQAILQTSCMYYRFQKSQLNVKLDELVHWQSEKYRNSPWMDSKCHVDIYDTGVVI
jgi:hypothetical protein